MNDFRPDKLKYLNRPSGFTAVLEKQYGCFYVSHARNATVIFIESCYNESIWIEGKHSFSEEQVWQIICYVDSKLISKIVLAAEENGKRAGQQAIKRQFWELMHE